MTTAKTRTARRNGRPSENATALRYALRAATRGCYIVPHGKNKRPLIRDWTGGGASRDPEQIASWSDRRDCTGFGILCGARSGEVVVDIDLHRNGSAASVKLTPTLTVSTPHGGTHHHYKTDVVVPPNPKLAEGVELLGDGRFAILPGSRIELEDGSMGTYRLVGKGQSRARLPTDLVPRVRAERAPDGRSGARAGISEGDRHEALVRRGASLSGKGLLGDEMFAVLTRFNERECKPPKAADEVRRIADWAVKLGGDDHAANVEAAVERMEIEREARAIVNRPARAFAAPTRRTLAEYLAGADAEEEYAIAGLLPKGGNATLVAQAKVGKTTMVGNLMRSFADRTPFLGRFDVDYPEGRVFFLDYEMTEQQYRSWLKRQGVENHDRVLPPWHLRDLGTPNPLLYPEEFAAWLRSENVKTLVIDSGARAQAEFVESGTASSQVMRFQDSLDKVKADAGISEMVVVLHAGVGDGGGVKRARDSTRWDDWPDAIWLYDKDDKGVRKLSAKGRGVSLDWTELSFDRQTDHLSAVRLYSDRTAEDKALAAVEALLAADKPLAREHLDAKLPSRMRAGVGIADDRGWIVSDWGDGPKGGRAKLYSVTDEGRSARRVKVPK